MPASVMKTAARRALNLWPLAACALIYLQIDHVIAWVGRPEIHDRLWAADLLLFGDHPSVWWAEHGTRAWTEVLAFCYLGYNLVVGAVAVTAVLRCPVPEARRVVRGLAAAYLAGYILYVLLPAAPPHAVLSVPSGGAAAGGWITALLGRSTAMNPSAAHGAFPSLHCAVTLVALLAARQLDRRLFRVLLLPAVGLLPAVLLLGHHYAADVLAGLVLGAAVHAGNGRGFGFDRRCISGDAPVGDTGPAPHSRPPARPECRH